MASGAGTAVTPVVIVFRDLASCYVPLMIQGIILRTIAVMESIDEDPEGKCMHILDTLSLPLRPIFQVGSPATAI